MIRWQRVVAFYHNVFNLKYAIMSAIFHGVVAVIVNVAHGPQEFLMAGLAQAGASFLSTGVTARVVQHFSPIRSAPVSYFLGSFVRGTMVFGMSFAAHFWNDTPEVLASCVAPTVVSYVSSYAINYMTRKGRLLPGNYKELEK